MSKLTTVTFTVEVQRLGRNETDNERIITALAKKWEDRLSKGKVSVEFRGHPYGTFTEED
jgi:hypothetical protein